MRGYRVERKGGWDCHGLPVEIAVEQELGITSKAEIEEYGIGEFNARCRESVFAYLEEWNRLTERIGFWLDLDDAYRTLDESYIESVWWALAADRRARAALRGPQGRPLLPALRDDAVLARGRARLPGRRRSECVPEAAGHRRPRIRQRGASCWSGRRRRGRCRATSRWRCRPRRATRGRASDDEHFVLAAARVVAGARARGRRSSSASAASELVERYGGYEGPIFALDDRAPGDSRDPRGRLRDDRGRHRHRAPRAGLWRGRLPRGGRGRDLQSATSRTRCTTRSGRTAPTTSACATATAAPTRAASSRTRS